MKCKGHFITNVPDGQSASCKEHEVRALLTGLVFMRVKRSSEHRAAGMHVSDAAYW